jgi:N-acetylglucosamine kinase-like BadF-type ATPase
MSSILIAESGSTKTDWCLLKKGKKPVYFRTGGINPYLQHPDEIKEQLAKELPADKDIYKAGSIAYYGAGAGSVQKKQVLKDVLKSYFKIKDVDVQSDLVAAARSLCGSEKGIVCILGTGSNSGFYNGKKISLQKPSLGYIAGDEGSGNHLGKRVLQYYAYNTFDSELKMVFEQYYGTDINAIVNTLYTQPFPNRYLAQFVKLLIDNRGHFMVENIIEDCLNDFFQQHILKYRQSYSYPLYFTGAVAFGFKDVIENLCGHYELNVGSIAQNPIEGLLKYHKN